MGCITPSTLPHKCHNLQGKEKNAIRSRNNLNLTLIIVAAIIKELIFFCASRRNIAEN